jgi:hypothetical protein
MAFEEELLHKIAIVRLHGSMVPCNTLHHCSLQAFVPSLLGSGLQCLKLRRVADEKGQIVSGVHQAYLLHFLGTINSTCSKTDTWQVFDDVSESTWSSLKHN